MQNESFTIRPATEDDIDEIYEISCAVHSSSLYRKLIPDESYPQFEKRYIPNPQGLAAFYEKYVARLHDPQWKVWVAEEDDEVIGFTVCQKQQPTLLLKGLFVLEKHQGKGVGKKLFNISCDEADSGETIVLEVIEANTRAIGLYEASGFTRGEVLDAFYGAPLLHMYKQV